MTGPIFITAIALVAGSATVLGSLKFAMRYLELRQLRTPPAPALDGLMERLQRIEMTVESTAIEVERISEGQRFTTRLLADRTGGTSAPRQHEPVITPH